MQVLFIDKQGSILLYHKDWVNVLKNTKITMEPSISFTEMCQRLSCRMQQLSDATLIRKFTGGQYIIMAVPYGGEPIKYLYQGPNVSEAIFAWYSALGTKVVVLYHRGDTLFPVPEPGTTCLWMVPTTREVSKSYHQLLLVMSLE